MNSNKYLVFLAFLGANFAIFAEAMEEEENVGSSKYILETCLEIVISCWKCLQTKLQIDTRGTKYLNIKYQNYGKHGAFQAHDISV